MWYHKNNYSQFLSEHASLLHFTAHSHHFWPDVSREGHMRAWDDAARYSDSKWDHVFTDLIPSVQKHIAKRLELTHPECIAFGSNTHELVFRLLSAHDFFSKRFVVLTTDGEFHSFTRQLSRLSELPFVRVVRVPIFPFSSFKKRFLDAAKQHNPDFTYFSHVFFETGDTVRDLGFFVDEVKQYSETIVVDGYHGFCAIPTSLADIEDIAFYVAGGYKYAQSGEGCAFMTLPKNCALRPLYTGWFADIESLGEEKNGNQVLYGEGAQRFMGSTFDPTGLYRMNAVMDWMEEIGLTVPAIHEHAIFLQEYFLEKLRLQKLKMFTGKHMVTPRQEYERSHFLSFYIPDAKKVVQNLKEAGVIVDSRGEHLRIGFGLYHSKADIDRLIIALVALEK
jgi:selenocysteine lyase/cysteine desulfurase